MCQTQKMLMFFSLRQHVEVESQHEITSIWHHTIRNLHDFLHVTCDLLKAWQQIQDSNTLWTLLSLSGGRWGGASSPRGCTRMTTPTAMPPAPALSARTARATGAWRRTSCGRRRTWPRCWTTVPAPTGPRGRRGCWDCRTCSRVRGCSGGMQKWCWCRFDLHIFLILLILFEKCLKSLYAAILSVMYELKFYFKFVPCFCLSVAWSWRGFVRSSPGCLQTLTARYESVCLCNTLTELSHMKCFEK